jgi:hypothetical protein
MQDGEFNVLDTVTIKYRTFKRYPTILTLNEFNEMYNTFLEHIRNWHTQYEYLSEEYEVRQDYPDLLMWIEYVKFENIYTPDFENILNKIYSSTNDQDKQDLIEFTEFYSSLFLHYHPEFLDIVQGRCYYMLTEVLKVDPVVIGTDLQLRKYSWRWIIPYYVQAIPKEKKLGIIRMNTLLKSW